MCFKYKAYFNLYPKIYFESNSIQGNFFNLSGTGNERVALELRIYFYIFKFIKKFLSIGKFIIDKL